MISSCRDKNCETEPVIGHWESGDLDFLLGIARENGVSFEIEDSLYVGLGRVNDSFEYNDNTLWRYTKHGLYTGWKKRVDFPGKPRVGAVAFVIGKKAYVGLGRSIENPKEYYKDFWVFDAEADSWSPLEFEFPGDAVADAVAFSLDGIGYLGTGKKAAGNCSGEFYMFDPKLGWGGMANMVLPRTGATVFKLDEYYYLAFGYNSQDNHYEDMRDVYRFDAKEFKFKPVKPLLPDKYPGITRSYASSFVLKHNGQEYAYFVGGKLGNDVTEPYWFCCRYDYVKDIWEKVAAMPRNNVSVTTWVDENTAFVFWNDAVLKFVPDK